MKRLCFPVLFAAGAAAFALASGCRTGHGSMSVADVVRFGIVTDVHYADTDTRGTRYYRESLGKLRAAILRMNREDLDFVVELGDLKDQTEPPDEWETLQYLRTIEREFQRFHGPTYHVLGNHDLDSLSKGQFLEEVCNTGIDPDRSYYSFMAGGVQVIVLDANFRRDGRPYDYGQFDGADANIPRGEARWLIDTLLERDGPAVILVHQRLDGEGPECIRNASEIRSLFKASGRVLAVFQGHDHRGGICMIDGIPYYTLMAMVEGHGPENSASAIVEIRRDRSLRVTGFNRAVNWP